MKKVSYARILNLLFTASIFSCKEEQKGNFIFDTPNNKLTQKIIKYDSSINIGFKTYFYFELNSWKGKVDSSDNFAPEFSYRGLWFKDGKRILYQPYPESGYSIFFDFNMKKNDSVSIRNIFKFKAFKDIDTLIRKEYYLKLVDKIETKDSKDTIYQFKLKNFGFKLPGDNLIFFASLNSGVWGIYVTINTTDGECIYMSFGEKDLFRQTIPMCDVTDM